MKYTKVHKPLMYSVECILSSPAVIAGVGKLEQHFNRALQDVEQVRALVSLPDQVLAIAEHPLCQARPQNLQQMILQKRYTITC